MVGLNFTFPLQFFVLITYSHMIPSQACMEGINLYLLFVSAMEVLSCFILKMIEVVIFGASKLGESKIKG